MLIPSCTKEDTKPEGTEIGWESIYIQNFTGHLVRRSGTRCGAGVKVAFVLSTNDQRREAIYEQDTYRNMAIPIEKGERLQVSAYEINGENRILLASHNILFDPPPDDERDVNPTVVLCPKDVLLFFDFNEE